jgi:hypothetical protein
MTLPPATQQPERPDARVAQVAAGRWGVISRADLLECGLNTSSITARVRDGRLHRVFRGVYSVIPPSMLRTEGWRVAVVLACGPDAVLSHESAAEFWGMRPHNGTFWSVTVPGDRGRRLKNVRAHQMKLDPADVTFVDGIWVTTPARPLLDLAEVVGADQLPRALERAEELRLFDLRAIEAAMARAPGRRGLKPLDAALDLYRPGVVTRSELERRALDLVAAAGLPAPAANAEIAGIDGEVDLLWADRAVVVEIDSARYHSSRRAFERDRRKSAELTALGYRVIRVTDRQLTTEPDWVADRIATVLGAHPPPAPVPPPAARRLR